MLKILKTIKYLIEIKNDEELKLEIVSLKNCDDFFIIEIVYLVEQNQMKLAIEKIDHYLSKNSLVKDYHHNTVGLKTFKSLLETKLSVLCFQKIDLDKLLNDFRNQNVEILGTILKSILNVRVRIREIQSNNLPSVELDEAIEEQSEFESYYNEKNQKPTIHLNEDEIFEIKKMYRKASKLCHPDLVDDYKKEQASFYFMELNLAYIYGNINRVRELLSVLDSEQWLYTDYQIAERNELEQAIKRLSYEINKTENEIKEIKDSPEYKLIISIENWSIYFNKLKKKFEKDLENLQQELSSIDF